MALIPLVRWSLRDWSRPARFPPLWTKQRLLAWSSLGPKSFLLQGWIWSGFPSSANFWSHVTGIKPVAWGVLQRSLLVRTTDFIIDLCGWFLTNLVTLLRSTVVILTELLVKELIWLSHDDLTSLVIDFESDLKVFIDSGGFRLQSLYRIPQAGVDNFVFSVSSDGFWSLNGTKY